MLSPGDALRKRTQVPVSTELNYLDFDSNSEIIKSLTGSVKPEYADLFKNATGSAAFKVSLKLEPSEIPGICTTLLDLYESDEYITAFPNIQNIVPVNDPSEIDVLDAALIDAFISKNPDVKLGIPDIIDYRDNTCCIFQSDSRSSDVEPDVSIGTLYKFLDEDGGTASTSLQKLRSWRVLLTDFDGNVAKSYQVYRSLIFDYEPDSSGVVYHFCEGKWYRAQKSFVDRLHFYIDGKCEDSDLFPYDHDQMKDDRLIYSEGNYNEAVPVKNPSIICLDQCDISPNGSTAIEPCDLYQVVDDPTAKGGVRAILYGVKISTRSSQLSHLFNQGVNAIELLRLEESSRTKLKLLISGKLGNNDEARYHGPIDNSEFKVVFGIITRRDKTNLSKNLPLFSKISLMRSMQTLELYRVQTALVFIKDDSAPKEGHPKHPRLLVEVVETSGGRREIRIMPGQDAGAATVVNGCPKVIRESENGKKFRIMVKTKEDGSLSSHHKWPYEVIN